MAEGFRIVNLVVDVQFGSAAQFVKKIRQSVDELRERGIPTIWLSMDNRSELFRPVEVWPNSSAKVWDVDKLEAAGFFGHTPDASAKTLQKFRDLFTVYGPKADEALFPKAFFNGFAVERDLSELDKRVHFSNQRKPGDAIDIDKVFQGQSLLDYLKNELKAEHVTLMGGNADVCVLETAMGAAANGFKATIFSDRLVSIEGDRYVRNPPEQYTAELSTLRDKILDRPQELAGDELRRAYALGHVFTPAEKTAIQQNLNVETFDGFVSGLPNNAGPKRGSGQRRRRDPQPTPR